MEAKINQVKYKLSNMGLNDYQASVLAHLMYLGETKATTISKSSGVPNARIYGVLDELSQKGLIIIRPGRPALYAPLSPQEIGDAFIITSREEIRRELAVIEANREDFMGIADNIFLKAGTSEQRTSLLRIVSVGDVSIEETRKLYRLAKSSLNISTRAMEYLDQVKDELLEAVNREIMIRVIMRKQSTLNSEDAAKQEQNLKKMQAFLGEVVKIRFSDEVEIRGCIIDPETNGRALFLVEEEGVPFFLREAAITAHPGVAKALGSMFELKWKFDSD